MFTPFHPFHKTCFCTFHNCFICLPVLYQSHRNIPNVSRRDLAAPSGCSDNEKIWGDKALSTVSASLSLYGCFLKWWSPTTMDFPTKNDHFGMFWGYHHLRKPPYQQKHNSFWILWNASSAQSQSVRIWRETSERHIFTLSLRIYVQFLW